MHIGENTMKISELLSENYSMDEINQSINGLSSQEQAEFERIINAWMQSRPWGVDVKGVNEIISFYNRAGRSSGKTPSEILAMVSDFIVKNPGRGAPVSETTSAGSVAAVAAPIGGMQSRQPKNPDGTARNALDSDTLMAGKKKKTKSKKA
jgi:hypothetical protein